MCSLAVSKCFRFMGCLHDTGTSFIPVRNLISYRVYIGVILSEWYEVSCEPSFLQASLGRCWLSTGIISHHVVRFNTGMRTGVNSYWYNISCYKWEPGWTGMKLVPTSCKQPRLSLLIRLMLVSVLVLVSVTKTQNFFCVVHTDFQILCILTITKTNVNSPYPSLQGFQTYNTLEMLTWI